MEKGERAAQTSLHLCKVGQKVDIFSFINHLSGSVAQVDTAKTTGKWPLPAPPLIPTSAARVDQTSMGRPVINYTNGIKLRQLGKCKYASQY